LLAVRDLANGESGRFDGLSIAVANAAVVRHCATEQRARKRLGQHGVVLVPRLRG